MNAIQKHPRLIAGTVIALVVVLFAYSLFNGLYNTGVQYEQRLKNQYLDNQNYLSAYISGFYEQVSVARGATDALDQILLDAVKGRYENTSAGGGGYTVNSPFFNAIVEAYPEASPQELVKIWSKLQDYVASQREGYRNVQSKLLDMLRAYDTWRYSGLIQSKVVSIVGFPSQRLEARFGNNVLTGQRALDKMYELVLDSKTRQAYENGTLDPLEIPTE